LKIWIWGTLLFNKESLPTESKVSNPKIQYEWLSGSFVWEDEGLWEIRSRHLKDVFKYVIKHRMSLITGQQESEDVMRSKKFDQQVFRMVQKRFPDWIGFDEKRCSFDSDLAQRIVRIKKVEDWRIQKIFDEEEQ
jgi:hypothetical protein